MPGLHQTFSRRTFAKGVAAAGVSSLALGAAMRGGALAAPGAVGAHGLARFQATPTGTLAGTITVTYPDQLGKKPPFVTAAADAVEKANPQATVKVTRFNIPEDQYYTKLLLSLNQGGGPDVFHVGGGNIGELADAGYIEPLDSYLANWADWQFYPDSVRSGVTYKGKVWAIPYGLDVYFLYYRKDVFTAAGLDPDWALANLDGIPDAAKAIQAKDSKVIPYVIYAGTIGSGGTLSAGFQPTVAAYNGRLYQDDKWIGSSPAIDNAFKYYENVFRTLKLVPSTVLTTPSPWTAMRQKLGDGSLGILFEGGWVYGGWQSTNATETKEDIGYLLYPTVDKGPSFTIGGPGTCWFMNAKSKDKDLAWAFIAAFNNKETVAQLNIEDPHPVARTDSAQVPAFAADKFLVDSTTALKSAIFLPPDPNASKQLLVAQQITGQVASGEMSAADASKKYLSQLKQAVGDANVTTVSS